MWVFIKENVLSLIILCSVFSISGVVYEIRNVQNEIKKTLEIMLKDPKNIVVEDMKVLAGTFGLGEKENERIKKSEKWKIIGIISIFINAFFILITILGVILSIFVQ